MIEEVDQRLRQWVLSTLSDLPMDSTPEVDFEPPGAELLQTATANDTAPNDTAPNAKIHLYLMEMRRVAPVPGRKRPPRRLLLRYLVTASASSHTLIHRLLGNLAFAALENTEFELDENPLPLELWSAFKVAPRPGFVLQAPVDLRVEPRRGPLVEKALVLETENLVELHGLVVGPGDRPIAGARVGIPALGRSTYTDGNGRFTFGAISQAAKRLRIEARGRELDVSARPGSEPLVIRWQPTED